MLSFGLALVLTVAPDAGVQHSAAMKEALDAVTTLTPWLPSPSAFREPANRQAISGAFDVFARLKHPYLRKAGAPSAGVANLFATQAERARFDFERGNTESARRRAQAMTQLCIGCHLSEPRGDFAGAAKVVEALRLPPLQRAEYFASTRQIDRALEVWRAELVRPVKVESELYEQLDALRLAVRVVVSAKDDPKLVQQLLAPQLKRKELPPFVRRELERWLQDAVAWEKEGFSKAAQKPAALLEKAKVLLEASGAEKNVAPVPEQALKCLRAASYLDEAMRQDAEGPQRAELLYFSGVAHGAVPDPALWELEWTFFEACIRENPGTPIAQVCAERLKERTWFAWRVGVDIPASTHAALGALMALANGRK
ncbi:MAG: hypothetical protein ACOZQL_08175 [Myxococcota bacterium]